MADEKMMPQPLPDNFPVADADIDMLMETCQAFVNYHVLPYAGGWMDQPEWWTTWLKRVYMPGLSRARFESLPDEAKRQFHRPRVDPKPVIEEGQEW